MRDARRDAHWDCNGQWLWGQSIPWESQRSKYLREVDGQGFGRVATSDATLRRPICMCTFVDYP
jgi:hypothetical protein